MRPHDCMLATVVEKPGCSVCICNHGILHLTIGSVTLRLAHDSLEPLAAVLSQAVDEIRRADAVLGDGALH